MRLFTITVAYCPAALLARSLVLYTKHRNIRPYIHIVVDGHYPINQKKNSNDIKLLTQCFDDVVLWDPGSNLGSAQSQNWALRRLDINEDDVFINLDPDSACLDYDWDTKLLAGLDNSDCVLSSCMAPMVKRYMNNRNWGQGYVCNGVGFGIPSVPTPFNLSLWRYSFIKEIGGIPQMGLWWGETEGAFWGHCKQRGKFHAYCLDVMENEDGKFIQDKEQNEWKDLHMRTAPPNNFLGNFEEYLRWKHPKLLEIDTCKDLSNTDHP